MADPSLKFYKYQALGNDYIVVDAQKYTSLPNPAFVRTLCDRHYGVGADGVLYGPIIEPAGFRVRIFNSDGSEAEKSGNGIRIFARYLHDLEYVSGNEGTVLTTAGSAYFRYLDPQVHRIEVDMGTVTFFSRQIPVSGPDRNVIDEALRVGDRTLRISCLSVGNPHCVVPMKGATEAEVKHFGPLIENHAMFPNRTNVQFLDVIDRDRISIKIWERGAGYTLASGSSSCAAASAARELGLVGDRVQVEMPGGVMQVTFGTDRHVRSIGDVRSTIHGTVSGDLASALTNLPFPT
jgi:diaminopimelate epimerase